jgi:DNA-binding response OmpR family regulator
MDLGRWPETIRLETFRALSPFCIGRAGGEPSAADAIRAGAMEFVLRGSDPEELRARLDRAVGVRGAPRAAPVRLRVNFGRSSVEIDGTELVLRRAELAVLCEIARPGSHPAKDLVKAALRANGNGHSASNQVYEIQRKFRRAGLPKPIQSVRRFGYRLAEGVELEILEEA